MYVIKANGEKEPFDEEKVRRTIKRAGIDSKTEEDVLTQVKRILYENIPTSEIYSHVREYLGKSPNPFGKGKYSLKQAIMDFGPTGFPFEDFISEILKAEGYKTNVRVVLTGKCVNHEVDIVAEKDGKKIMVEAKFHNLSGIRTDLHVSLYTKARFDDLKEKHGLEETWLVTNTKMTVDAIAYANCVGMKILSWSYPNENSIRDIIERKKLFPITTLESISNQQKQVLLQNHVILCKDLENPSCLDVLGLPKDKIKQILEESRYIYNHQ